MNRLALINFTTNEILSEHVEGRGRVQIPGETVTVSPPVAGWSHGDFALVPVVPHEPAPEGQQVVSVERSIVGGQVVETVTYEDIPAPPPPSEVSRRQFKMQLAIAGLTATVEAWVEAQDALVQIAYAESGSFKRSEPMMLAGFDALGFAPEQIDAFFTEASQL